MICQMSSSSGRHGMADDSGCREGERWPRGRLSRRVMNGWGERRDVDERIQNQRAGTNTSHVSSSTSWMMASQTLGDARDC